MNKELVLAALANRLHDILYWEPDYEECGPQFGPDLTDALDIIDEMIEIDPKRNISITSSLKQYIIEEKLEIKS
jgi:hypothetical protein